MLLARLAQGAGGELMLSLSYVAIQRLFPAHLWTRLLAVHAAVWGAPSLCGPLIGGLFAEAGYWRGAFWAFAAQAALLTLFAGLRFREPGDDHPIPGARSMRDLPWRPLLALSLATLAIAAAGLVAPAAVAILAAGELALLALAGWLDAGSDLRLMPHGALRPGHPIGAGLAGGAAAAHSYQAAVWVFGTCVPLPLTGYAAVRRI